MRIIADVGEMKRALVLASSVAPRKSPRPICEGACLTAGPEGAHVRATDFEIALRVRLSEVRVDEEGSAVVPLGRLLEMLNKMPHGCNEVAIERIPAGKAKVGKKEVKGGPWLRITSEATFHGPTWDLADSFDPEQFPVFPGDDVSARVEVAQADLRTLIDRTAPFVDPESTRFALGGVHLELEEVGGATVLRGVGTDGRRLSDAVVPVARFGEPAFGGMGAKGFRGYVVPEKALKVVRKLAADPKGDGEPWSVEPNVAPDGLPCGVSFAHSRGTLYARLCEGRFPKWSEVFPDEEPSAVLSFSDATELLRAVRLAGIATSEEDKSIRVEAEPGSLTVWLWAQAPDAGDADVSTARDRHAGETVRVALQPDFLAEGLEALGEGRPFDVQFHGEQKPVVLACEGFRHAVMPTTDDRKPRHLGAAPAPAAVPEAVGA